MAERLEELVFKAFPTLDQWKRASSVALAVRDKDVILNRIDELVDASNRAADDGARLYIRCDLFFTLDYWLKTYKHSTKMDKGREPAVMNLYKYVAYRLSDAFKCQINVLPRELEFYFGRELSAHGSELDAALNCASYLKRADLRKYKIYFKEGLAYQFPWWKTTKSFSESKFELADSSHASNPAVFDPHSTGYRRHWGGFAMSMGRDIYMAKHHCTRDFGENGNFYHSSYLGGQHVMLAGTMLIERGVIKAVSTDSGHYQPDQRHVINLLQTLQMYGVHTGSIDIQDYTGAFVAKGSTFLTNNGNWAAMVARRQANLTHIARNLRETQVFEDRIKKLWDQGVRSHIFQDNMEGRIYFAGTLLPYYVDGSGDRPFQGANMLYVLNALNRATHRAPDASQKWWFDKWTDYLRTNRGVTDNESSRKLFAQYYGPPFKWPPALVCQVLDKAYTARNLPNH